MPTSVKLLLDHVELMGELGDGPAAQEVAAHLPLTMTLSRWGEEYYGSLGAPMQETGGERRDQMAVGELAYWEPGSAFCVFFGPTPASRGDEPRAASPVIPLGAVSGDWASVSALGSSVKAVLSKA